MTDAPAATPAPAPSQGTPQSGTPPPKPVFEPNPSLGAKAFLADHYQAMTDGRPGATDAYQKLQDSGDAARIAEIAKANPNAPVVLGRGAAQPHIPAHAPIPNDYHALEKREREIMALAHTGKPKDEAEYARLQPELRAVIKGKEDIKNGKQLQPPPAATPQAPPSAQPVQPGEAASVIVPGKDATPEVLAAFKAAVGAPDSPDKYAPLKQVEGIEVTARHKEQWGGLQQLLHKHNASAELGAEIADYYESIQKEGLAENKKAQEAYDKAVAANEKAHEDHQAARAEAKEAAHAESMAWLEAEYGDDADKAIEGAKAVMRELHGGKAAADKVGAMLLEDGSELGSHPAFVKMVVRLAELEAQRKG